MLLTFPCPPQQVFPCSGRRLYLPPCQHAVGGPAAAEPIKAFRTLAVMHQKLCAVFILLSLTY